MLRAIVHLLLSVIPYVPGRLQFEPMRTLRSSRTHKVFVESIDHMCISTCRKLVTTSLLSFFFRQGEDVHIGPIWKMG